jgi:glycosyltransferase involved in cell wall biosynthesis
MLGECARRLNLRHVVVRAPRFNQSLAQNIGASCSTGRILCFLDADLMLSSDLLGEARGRLDAERCFVKIHRVRESEPNTSRSSHPSMVLVTRWRESRELVYACPDGREATACFTSWNDGSRSGAGFLAVARADFLAAGGFNSTLTGWGFDDVDFQLRLQFVLRLAIAEVGEAVHLTHRDDTRNMAGADRRTSHEQNVAVCMARYQQLNFQGTYDEDVARWRADEDVPQAIGAGVPASVAELDEAR